MLVFTNCLHTFSKLRLLFSKLYTKFSENAHTKCLTSPSKCNTAFKMPETHVRMKHLRQMAHLFHNNTLLDMPCKHCCCKSYIGLYLHFNTMLMSESESKEYTGNTNAM